MGMLFRMFAPKSAKKVRRAAHPVERDDAAAGAQGEGAGERCREPRRWGEAGRQASGGAERAGVEVVLELPGR